MDCEGEEEMVFVFPSANYSLAKTLYYSLLKTQYADIL